MRTVKAACVELLAQLRAEGFTGSGIDPAEVNPPAAVWINPQGIRDLTLGGGGTLEVWLHLIVPNVDPLDAMELLDDGLAALLGMDLVLSPDDAIDLRTPVLLPNNPNPLPAYRLAVDLDL